MGQSFVTLNETNLAEALKREILDLMPDALTTKSQHLHMKIIKLIFEFQMITTTKSKN